MPPTLRDAERLAQPFFASVWEDLIFSHHLIHAARYVQSTPRGLALDIVSLAKDSVFSDIIKLDTDLETKLNQAMSTVPFDIIGYLFQRYDALFQAEMENALINIYPNIGTVGPVTLKKDLEYFLATIYPDRQYIEFNAQSGRYQWCEEWKKYKGGDDPPPGVFHSPKTIYEMYSYWRIKQYRLWFYGYGCRLFKDRLANIDNALGFFAGWVPRNADGIFGYQWTLGDVMYAKKAKKHILECHIFPQDEVQYHARLNQITGNIALFPQSGSYINGLPPTTTAQELNDGVKETILETLGNDIFHDEVDIYYFFSIIQHMDKWLGNAPVYAADYEQIGIDFIVSIFYSVDTFSHEKIFSILEEISHSDGPRSRLFDTIDGSKLFIFEKMRNEIVAARNRPIDERPLDSDIPDPDPEIYERFSLELRGLIKRPAYEKFQEMFCERLKQKLRLKLEDAIPVGVPTDIRRSLIMEKFLDQMLAYWAMDGGQHEDSIVYQTFCEFRALGICPNACINIGECNAVAGNQAHTRFVKVIRGKLYLVLLDDRLIKDKAKAILNCLGMKEQGYLEYVKGYLNSSNVLGAVHKYQKFLQKFFEEDIFIFVDALRNEGATQVQNDELREKLSLGVSPFRSLIRREIMHTTMEQEERMGAIDSLKDFNP
jgi:hypothetical protein